MASHLGTLGNIVLELSNELVLVVVVTAAFGEGLETGERLAIGVRELPGPSLQCGLVMG